MSAALPDSPPLADVTVLDLSHALAGPACTQVLRRYGARVIKIERPVVGDDLRHYTEHAGLPAMSVPFCSANAGKHSITLDLKNPEARPVFERLVRRADVLVENYRPGVMHSLGADWPRVKLLNPRLIYCSITGFGQSGELRERPAYDHIVQAVSGIMSMNGDPASGPMRVGLPAVDTFSGYFAAIGILAALRRRDRTGVGEFIDVAMLDAATTLMASAVATHLHSGEPPRKSGNRGFRLVPTSGMFATRDGHIQVGANHQHQVERLFGVLGCTHLFEDARFRDHRSRVAHAAELHAILGPLFAGLDAQELELQLAEQQVPAAKVRTIPEIVQHPHFAARDLILEARVAGSDQVVKVVRGVPILKGASNQAGEVPAVGQQTDEVLRWLDFGPEEIQQLRETGAL